MKFIKILAVVLACATACAEKDYFADLPENAQPETVYRKMARLMLSTQPEAYHPEGYTSKGAMGSGKYVHYSTNSVWINCMQIASMLGDKEILDSLGNQFYPFLYEKAPLQSRDDHVDFSIFGAIPLEVYLTKAGSEGHEEDLQKCLELGLRYADHQWEKPDTVDPNAPMGNKPLEDQIKYYEMGFSPQTRLWIDDMYMINILQTQAYRATGDYKYIDRAAQEMVFYIENLQLPDGLFHHAEVCNFVWGRGDGWMAAGMPMILQYLKEDHPCYKPILAGYRKMMHSLLKWQRDNGLWGQLVNDPESWDESSCSAMFAFSFVKGVQNGWLNPNKYGPAARKAWISLCNLLDDKGNIANVCIGTGAKDSKEHYYKRPRHDGDPHGQAPMLWICNALLSK